MWKMPENQTLIRHTKFYVKTNLFWIAVLFSCPDWLRDMFTLHQSLTAVISGDTTHIIDE